MSRKKSVTVPAIRIAHANNKARRVLPAGTTLYFFRDGTPAPEPHGSLHFPVADHRIKAKEVQQWINTVPPWPWRPDDA